MSATARIESKQPQTLNPIRVGQQGYAAHIAKQLAKSGKLADMLNGSDEMLRHVAPEAREDLMNIARAVRFALLQQGDAHMSSRA